MFNHKLLISLVLILSSVGQYYSLKPKIQILENEPLEFTISSEDLKHLIRMKKTVDSELTSDEKNKKDEIFESITKNDVGSSKTSDNAKDILNKNNELTSVAPNINVSSADEPTNDNLNILNEKDQKDQKVVFNLNKDNPNQDLTYADKFSEANKNEEKKEETGSRNKSSDFFEGDTDDDDLANKISKDNSTTSPNDPPAQPEITVSSTTSPGSKFISSLIPTNDKKSARNKSIDNLTDDKFQDKKDNESIDNKSIDNKSKDKILKDLNHENHTNVTVPASSATKFTSIYSLIVCSAIIWFIF